MCEANMILLVFKSVVFWSCPFCPQYVDLNNRYLHPVCTCPPSASNISSSILNSAVPRYSHGRKIARKYYSKESKKSKRAHRLLDV